MNKKNIKLLYRSFDEPLNEQEQKALEKALKESKDLREDKVIISKMRSAVSENKAESFKPFFAGRVMKKIDSLEKPSLKDTEFESLFSIFRPVAVTAAVLIFMFILYNWFSNGQSLDEIALNETDISIVDAFDPMIEIFEE